MTSRDIATLTKKRHDNVTRVCRELIEQGLTSQIEELTFAHNGNDYIEFKLCKRDSILLVARLSPEFTAAIVDRWQELEEQQLIPHKIPQTYSEALQLAANQASQLELQAPMVEVYKLLADRKGDVSTTILAKQLETTAFKLNKFLRDKGLKWLNADLPKAGFEKYFNVVSDVKNNHEFTQCLITPDGQIEIAKLWGEK